MASKVNQSPALPRFTGARDIGIMADFMESLVTAVYQEFVNHAQRLNLAIVNDGTEPMTAPLVLASYTVAGVPAAASYTGGMIYVSNETGGAVPAFSDGTNWRRVTDRAIVA